MDEVQIEFVYKNLNNELKKEILSFWESENTFTNPQVGPNRVDQVLAIARKDNNIIGVASGVAGIYAPMGQRFMFYRTFISKNHRSMGVAKKLFNEVYDRFNLISQKEGLLGVFISVENDLLNKVNKPVIQECRNLTFIGFNKEGFQLRIAYFTDAQIQIE